MRAHLAFLAVLGSVVASSALATALELTETYPVLGGRLTLKLPKGAERIGRPADSIMEAAPSQDAETRYVLRLGTGKVVVFFADTNSLSPGANDEPLKKSLSQEKPNAKVTSFDAGSIHVLQQGPTQWAEVIPGGLLADSALLVLPDRTVVKVAFFVGPEVQDKEQIRAMATQALRTVQAGAKQAPIGKVEVEGIVVDVPQGWVRQTQSGPDFTVHHFLKRAVWGETRPSVVGFYVGQHPSYQHEPDPTAFKTERGTWLKRDVTWHVSGSATKLFEAMVEWPDGTTRHVWFSGPGAKDVVNRMQRK